MLPLPNLEPARVRRMAVPDQLLEGLNRSLVSSDASPTLPEWAAAWNRSSTIFGESGTTRSSGAGLAAALSVRIARATPPLHEPHVLRLALLLPATDGDQHPVAGAASSTSTQRRALTPLRRIPAMKRSPAITASGRPRSPATSGFGENRRRDSLSPRRVD